MTVGRSVSHSTAVGKHARFKAGQKEAVRCYDGVHILEKSVRLTSMKDFHPFESTRFHKAIHSVGLASSLRTAISEGQSVSCQVPVKHPVLRQFTYTPVTILQAKSSETSGLFLPSITTHSKPLSQDATDTTTDNLAPHLPLPFLPLPILCYPIHP